MFLCIPIDVLLRSNVLGTEGGYSLLWFIYLYLMGRYLKQYGIKWLERNKWAILVVCVIIQSVLFYFHLIGTRYTNPLILLPAICLILIFKDFTFHNRLINKFSSATLMVYMIHMHPCFIDEIRAFLSELYACSGYYFYLMEVISLIFVLYVFAFALDSVRLYIWKHLSYHLSKLV